MEEVKLTMLGQMDNTMDNTFESANRVYDCNGPCPTIPTMAGGNIEPKTIVAMRGRNPENSSDRTVGSPTEQRLEPNSQGICNTITSVQKDNMVLENRFYEQAIKVFQNNDCEEGDTIDAFNEKVNKTGVSPTITTRPEGLKTAILPVVRIESLYRIRKLTPRECFRLMGVNEADIEKMMSVNSNSQCYKQAGNSIVVNCMVAMFGNLNIQNKPRWSDIKDRY